MKETKTSEHNQNHLYHLHLIGKFAQTGFGFSCMKKAFELDVNGYLRYLSTGEIEMNLEGNENKINNFYQWCLLSQETSAANISAPFNHFNGLNEFEIINSL